MLSCIILSAGLSARFGKPKALAKIQGETTVIEYLQTLLLHTSIDEIIIVLGSEAEHIKPYLSDHKKIKNVYNQNYLLGQTSPFKIGLGAIHPKSEAVMLLPVDYPAVQQMTIEKLINCFLENKPILLIPTFENHKGHPPIFSTHLKNEFLNLDNDRGLNTIIHRYQAQAFLLPVKDPGVIESFNTHEEFEKIKAKIN